MGRGRVSDATDSPVPSLVPGMGTGLNEREGGKERRRGGGGEEERERQDDPRN